MLEIQQKQVIYHSQPHAGAGGAMRSSEAMPMQAESMRDNMQNNEQRVSLVEEEIAIGKREVEGGTIRVRTRVVADPISEEVRLRDETVEISRRPVDKEISPQEAEKLFQSHTISATEHKEEAVVAKTARVKEEVILSKDVGERVEQIDETVRRTEVEVDRSQAGLSDSERARLSDKSNR